MSLSRLYQSALLAHNRAPRHRGELANATHVARGTDALCGDDIRIWLRVEAGRIRQASWSGEACAITTAAASMLTDWLPGRSLEQFESSYRVFLELIRDSERADVAEFGDLNLLRAVSAFPSRRRNALLPWETALNALEADNRPASS
jgi:nitrogen fixation NifU-like protein